MLANTFSVSLAKSVLHSKYFRSSVFITPLLDFLLFHFQQMQYLHTENNAIQKKLFYFMSYAFKRTVFPSPPLFLSMEELSYILFEANCPTLLGDHTPHVIYLAVFSTSQPCHASPIHWPQAVSRHCWISWHQRSQASLAQPDIEAHSI